jgi:hypothetical protein
LRLQILSDLHLSQGALDIPATDADVVVLAGDIARPADAVAVRPMPVSFTHWYCWRPDRTASNDTGAAGGRAEFPSRSIRSPSSLGANGPADRIPSTRTRIPGTRETSIGGPVTPMPSPSSSR